MAVEIFPCGVQARGQGEASLYCCPNGVWQPYHHPGPLFVVDRFITNWIAGSLFHWDGFLFTEGKLGRITNTIQMASWEADTLGKHS